MALVKTGQKYLELGDLSVAEWLEVVVPRFPFSHREPPPTCTFIEAAPLATERRC